MKKKEDIGVPKHCDLTEQGGYDSYLLPAKLQALYC